MDNIKTSWLKVLGIAIFIILVVFVTVKLVSKPQSKNGNNVYDQVVSSGVIRACYVNYLPDFIKDPNTGKLSGIFVETLEKAADNMGLKVDWNAEIGWGELVSALNANKCDVVGSDVWANSARGKSADFTVPVYYSGYAAYARINDHRFDSDLNLINNKSYKIIVVDGEAAQSVAQTSFSNAQTVQLPQLTDVSQELINVADNKADVAFLEPSVANVYIKNNPGKIRQISKKPVIIYGNTIMLKKGESELTSSLNTAITELLNNGYIEQVLQKYEKEYPGDYYRVAPSYSIPTN